MALLPETVDYTAKDFDALRARLIALIQSVFPDWTDFDVARFGNVLLEMYAFVGDVLTFYQDSRPASPGSSPLRSARTSWRLLRCWVTDCTKPRPPQRRWICG